MLMAGPMNSHMETTTLARMEATPIGHPARMVTSITAGK